MSLVESDTRVKLIDPAIHARGWTEDLIRLFQEFVQFAAGKTQEGTGLGLALTKRLVEMHGDRIWTESEGVGRGSTFVVVFPFGDPHA